MRRWGVSVAVLRGDEDRARHRVAAMGREDEAVRACRVERLPFANPCSSACVGRACARLRGPGLPRVDATPCIPGRQEHRRDHAERAHHFVLVEVPAALALDPHDHVSNLPGKGVGKARIVGERDMPSLEHPPLMRHDAAGVLARVDRAVQRLVAGKECLRLRRVCEGHRPKEKGQMATEGTLERGEDR